MRKSSVIPGEVQHVTGIEGRALDMAIKAVLDLNAGIAPQTALAELHAIADEQPNWEEETDHQMSESFVALCPGNPHYLIGCIDGYRAEFLDQFQQVRKEAIASLREEGCAVVIFSAGELNGASARDVEGRLVEEGNALIEALAPAVDLGDDEPGYSPERGF